MTALPTVPWDPRWTCSEVETASPAATGIAALAATQILAPLAGSQFGFTSAKLRPCRRDCLPAGYEHGAWPVGSWGYPYPALVGGTWVNLGCAGCGDSCSCTTLQEAVLPGVVHDVTEVKIDGTVVTGSAYRLDHATTGDVLVRLDGGTWPTCQQLTRNDTQPGTWSVTARYGQDVPESGRIAVGELACEFLKGFAGQDCRLPRDVVSLARQGVTLNFPDPSSLLDLGQLGLLACDRFIRAVNPKGLRRRARTWSPDQRGLRQVGAE